MEISEPSVFDFAIIGAGSAGLQLALKMIAHPHFKGQRIAIIDRPVKQPVSKTWCYWEAGSGMWDHLIDHSWSKGIFYGVSTKIDFVLDPYLYKKLDAAIFIDHTRRKIANSSNCTWITDEVTDLTTGGKVEVKGKKGSYWASHVFDSRVNSSFYQEGDHIKVWQHFLGWEVELANPCFDSSTFTMMDYRLRYQDNTSFTYVLPFSDRRALIEYTFFTPYLVKEEVYEDMLRKYIRKYLGCAEYKISRIERGVIPMTDYKFSNDHKARITKIGTAGGWVRPSSGYSFAASGRYVDQIIEQIIGAQDLAQGVAQNRWRWYDRIFLHILMHHNVLGPHLFGEMYQNNDIQLLFRFLDEQSTFMEELKLFSSLPYRPFLKALLAILKRG